MAEKYAPPLRRFVRLLQILLKRKVVFLFSILCQTVVTSICLGFLCFNSSIALLLLLFAQVSGGELKSTRLGKQCTVFIALTQ